MDAWSKLPLRRGRFVDSSAVIRWLDAHKPYVLSVCETEYCYQFYVDNPTEGRRTYSSLQEKHSREITKRMNLAFQTLEQAIAARGM